jgi:transcriptional regulator GlxA family with amidase domain
VCILNGEAMAKRVKRVIEMMEGDPSKTFTLEKMAESVNLSAPYFCFLFKSITGMPPAKYLKSLRMQEAATLLTTTFLSVKEIVRRVGLADESHFVRDFKRHYGVTPSEFRNTSFLSSDSTKRETSQQNWPMNRKIGQLIVLASCVLLV